MLQSVKVELHMVQSGLSDVQAAEIHRSQGGVMRGGCSGNHRVGLGNTAVADHRRTLLDDAGLSSGNIGQGRPQLLGVVQPQSGE